MSTQEKFSTMTMKTAKCRVMIVLGTALVMVCGAQLASALMVEVPYEMEWASSGHADPNSEAFRHWDDEGEIPARCAKCHSTDGHLDFYGVDGSEPGVVNNPAPPGTTVECMACHNDATLDKDTVVFPSGIEVFGLGSSARCIECHQGRASGLSVDDAIADANLPDDDTVSEALSFKNIHYLAAGATQMGAEAHGGYQYAGKSYDVRLAHVEDVDTCVSCHDPHTLDINIDTCVTCHELTETLGVEDIRYMGSLVDYDGDYDTEEGIFYEITGLMDILYGAIQTYAEASGMSIVYDAHRYPYWFADPNNTGEGEASYNGHFTARLLKATYNYQFAMKDPGAYAHNPKYAIQLIFDSIEDLAPALALNLNRNDAGHFAGSHEAFRHWDDDGRVSGSCSDCHSSEGLPFKLVEGVAVSQPVTNGFMCSTCHDSVPEFTRYDVGPVVFPSGAVIDSYDPGKPDEVDSQLCMTCHQGRESGSSVTEAVAGIEADTVMPNSRFINVHYFAAAATRYGTEAGGAYEYPGKEYKGFFKHISAFRSCIECHDPHMGDVAIQRCTMCHRDSVTTADIRRSSTKDYDGDGDTVEGVVGEIETMAAALLATMEVYSVAVVGELIVYDAHQYPYFMKASGGRYDVFTPRLLEAAYNYQFVEKDPGGFAHNSRYVIQVLFDSIEDLGGDVGGMIRP
ncbi:MAG: hypothetical protein GY809_02195 [Planctomycetes bacterium]|nr:hypothetical protein [Planctomycetota bacterium]